MSRLVALVAVLTLLGACRTAAVTVPSTWERPGLGEPLDWRWAHRMPGEAAPELARCPIAKDTAVVSIASMRGSWVVVHFTATWCPFCDSEIEHLGELANAVAPRGVEDSRRRRRGRRSRPGTSTQASTWRSRCWRFTTPVVRALPASHLPERSLCSTTGAQAVLDATLVIDPTGVIRLFLLPDSAHFDPTFGGVRAGAGSHRPAAGGRRLGGEPRTLSSGDHAKLDVRLDIAGGYHVMSDRPSEPTYVATRVVVDGVPGIIVGEALYPPSGSFALAGQSISTFAGALDVSLPIDVASDASPGLRHLHGSVRYQACTEYSVLVSGVAGVRRDGGRGRARALTQRT